MIELKNLNDAERGFVLHHYPLRLKASILLGSNIVITIVTYQRSSAHSFGQ